MTQLKSSTRSTNESSRDEDLRKLDKSEVSYNSFVVMNSHHSYLFFFCFCIFVKVDFSTEMTSADLQNASVSNFACRCIFIFSLFSVFFLENYAKLLLLMCYMY